MTVTRYQTWQERDNFISEPEEALAVLRDPQFTTVGLEDYLDVLEQRLEQRFPHLRAFAQHSMIFQTGEAHLATRRLIAPFFGTARVATFQKEAEACVARALCRLANMKDPDLMSGFADVLNVEFFGEFLGIEIRDRPRVLELIRKIIRVSEPMVSLSRLTAIERAIAELDGNIKALSRKTETGRESFPDFLQARGVGAAEAQIYTLSILVGSYSFAHAIGQGLQGLLTGPAAEWDRLATAGLAGPDQDRLLSGHGTTLLLLRIAQSTRTVGGCPFGHGHGVAIDLPQTNARMRQAQGEAAGIPFGAGIHKCPGEIASRMVLALALPALARRFPRLSLHHDKVVVEANPLVRVPVALPCELHGTDTRLNARMVEIKTPGTAREIINDDVLWSPPMMAPHLQALEQRTGKDLSRALTIARNAMFFMSGPRHAVARREVAQVLGGNRLARWQPLIDAQVELALAHLSKQAAPDLITDFADPLFHGITHPILGIAPKDPDRFNAVAPTLQDVLEPWLPMRELDALQDVFGELLDQMGPPERAAAMPGASLLEHLQGAGMPGYEALDLKALVLVLYGASFNLAHTLGNALFLLLSAPSETRAGLAEEVHDPAALEDLISRSASPKYIYRMARAQTRIGGLDIRTNETLRLQLLSINRGAAMGNLAFGHGLHRCVGVGLSKRMLKSALPVIFRRFPDLSLLPARHIYFDMSQTVALKHLPCRLHK